MGSGHDNRGGAANPGQGGTPRRNGKILLGGMLLAVSFCGAALYSSARTGGAGQEDCQTCHPQVYADIASKPFVHRPEMEQKCAVCHVVDGAGGRESERTAVTNSAKEMSWVAKNLGKGREHWLRLGQGVAGQAVLIRTESEDGRVQQVNERVPDLSHLAESADERVPLLMEPPEVVNVRRGVLLAATIAWKTSKVSDSAVQYGEAGLGNTTPVDGQLTKQHEVVLTGLVSGKTYRFVTVSTDMAGNTVRSQEKTFSTARPFGKESQEAARRGGSQPLGTEKTFYRSRGQVLLHVVAAEPVSVMVGVAGQPEERVTAPRRENRPGGRLPARHPVLVDRYTLTITVCLTCHPATKGVVSHPVNVYTKNGMVIPDEYSTLADGRVSCVSCHVAHAGHHQYRIPKPTKKALCVGCHKNFR